MTKDLHVEKALFRPAEAAARLSIGRTTLYRWIKNGTLPTVRCGGIQFIPAGVLQALATSPSEQTDEAA